MTQPSTAELEVQGWYHRNATGEPVRVRLSIDAAAVSLHTLSGSFQCSSTYEPSVL